MIMKIKLDEGAIMPTRAHEADAGLDLYSPMHEYLPSKGAVTIDTGVHMELPPGTVGMVKSRSGLNFKHGLQCEGVIDEGYCGSIRVKLYNHGDSGYYIERCDKIAQLVIMPVIKPVLELVDELEDTERGDGGFGSTGK